MELSNTVCKDCRVALTPCPSCNLPRCGCRPATDVHADTVRYVHWLDGQPLQVSLEEHSRRMERERMALIKQGRCGVCLQHKFSQAHQHDCAAGQEERAARQLAGVAS